MCNIVPNAKQLGMQTNEWVCCKRAALEAKSAIEELELRSSEAKGTDKKSILQIFNFHVIMCNVQRVRKTLIHE
jgi:hypothetical protein